VKFKIMKKYITEELDADIRAVLDKFKDSPSDIQLAIEFAKECFPNLDLNSIGPAGYPNDKSKNCMKFKSTNPANSVGLVHLFLNIKTHILVLNYKKYTMR